MSAQDAERARERNVKELLAYPGVMWVGTGKKMVGGRETDEDCIVVGVRQKIPLDQLRPQDVIPRTLRLARDKRRTVSTDVMETGEPEATSTRREQWRPAFGGISIGHPLVTAGTLGAIVEQSGLPLILSNNHILAATNEATIGDSILQPGRIDGGNREDNAFARLTDFVPINFPGHAPLDPSPIARFAAATLTLLFQKIGGQTKFRAFREGKPGPNLVDAAVALPHAFDDVEAHILDKNNEPTIHIVGIKPLELGMQVCKSGRTTGFTKAKVVAVNASVRVRYGECKTALMEDQVVIAQEGTTRFSAGGDSGSVILVPEEEDDEINMRLGGLLFAASPFHTFANRVEHVFRLLDLEIWGL